MLCRPCKGAMDLLKVPESSHQSRTLTVKSLYRWQPGQSDLLSRLILGLKGGGHSLAWRSYAEEMISQNISSLEQGRRIYVVPAPGRTAHHKDHAFEWGKAVAEHLGAQFLPCLSKVSLGTQRKADRGERALVRMEAHVKTSDDPLLGSDRSLWIFADDVITTGATAWAAYQALGSPPHFEVWTLAQRGLSCGASKDLL